MKSRRMTQAEILDSVLIPANEWHPLDHLPAPEYVPPQWDGPHVGVRMVEAFKTLSRLPMGGTNSKSGIWPAYSYDWEDLLAQRGSDAEALEQDAREQNRTRLLPSAEDVSRMEKVIGWPARYLGTQPRVARLVQRVAYFRTRDLSLDAIARRMRRPAGIVRRNNRDGLDVIAGGLRREGVPVF